MNLYNYTPFSPLIFESQNVEGGDFQVVALKGTFEIVGGAPLRPVVDQEPPVMADEFRGDPMSTSLRRESELVPFKPRADIFIEADAHAPNGLPARTWLVMARVGDLVKRLQVTGPRFWERTLLGTFRLVEPEPCLTVPIRYEHAYGGTWEHGRSPVPFEENPAGVGFARADGVFRQERIPAPRIESPDDPISRLSRTYRPEGFGPIAKQWLPRRSLAGTPNDVWLRDRWPALPEDFDYSYFNAAHPDLIAKDFLRGDEPVELEGLTPEGTLRFSLPGYTIHLGVLFDDGEFGVAPCQLDTLTIDLPARRASLIWRATFPLEASVRAIEARMTFPGGETNGG